ncbi:MAG: hypothetical protein JSS93_01450 [Bacteroidetes bacterium]|nr:hypothetical protein [Bacteroidota bacterium]
MKLRLFRLVLSGLLIGTLLFAQVAVNFFHKNHDIHRLKSTSSVPLKSGEAGVQTHDGEHCRVCAVDFFNHSFIENTTTVFEQTFYAVVRSCPIFSYFFIPVSFSKDRAPPSLFS